MLRRAKRLFATTTRVAKKLAPFFLYALSLPNINVFHNAKFVYDRTSYRTPLLNSRPCAPDSPAGRLAGKYSTILGSRTLRPQDTSASRHFGTIKLVVSAPASCLVQGQNRRTENLPLAIAGL